VGGALGALDRAEDHADRAHAHLRVAEVALYLGVHFNFFGSKKKPAFWF
jgi:hypothetical protein